MNAEIRFNEVSKLRSHLCQDYLKLVLQTNWQEKLFKRAKEKVESNQKSSSLYEDIYVKMRKTTPESIRVEDLDITLIMEIVGKGNDIIERSLQPIQTKSAFLNLRLDRNYGKHLNDNESDAVLYLKALLGLTRMDEFLTAFDKYSKDISPEDRLILIQKYHDNIVELQEAVDDERTDLIQTKKEFGKLIERVQNSNDPLNTWLKVYKIIQEKYWASEKESDRKKFYDFLIKASDGGIPYAHGHVLIYCKLFNTNYRTEEEKRMELILNDFNPVPLNEAESVIDVINDRISEGDYSEKMQQIIQRVIDLIDPMYQVVKNNNRFVVERRQ